jgi:hypothetical protein
MNTQSSARQNWRIAFQAARSGRALYPEQAFSVEALALLNALKRSPLNVRHDRWLSKSIADISRASKSAAGVTETARWLVPARAALYASWHLHRGA